MLQRIFALVLTMLSFTVNTQVLSQQKTRTDDSACSGLKRKVLALNIAGLTITDIQFIPAGSYTPKATGKELTELPAFCLVAAVLKPTSGSYIKIELWMPQTNWNGRLLGTGTGGGGGGINYGSLVSGLKKGYATTNTDLGTSRGGANAAVGQPEIWADFGHRSTHEMTVVSKTIVKAYYGKAQHHAYFVGCSTGGQQALMEAQKYPGDYNGIVAGAPANNRTHLHTDFLLNYKATNKNKKALFSNEELSFITRKIVAAYAGKDGGAPGDNFFTDPGMVKVNFDELFKCKTGNDSCLSDEKITALKEIYAGPINPRTHEQIYTAPPVGSENVPGGLILQQTPQGADGLFYQYKWVFGKDFDHTKFDFDKDQAKMDSMLAPILNANNPDLSRVKKSGSKIIMFTGTADPLVPYQDAVNYYERVISKQGSLQSTQSFFRYFLVPGMGHCGAGPGLNDVNENILLALIDWVERGKAPEEIIATALNCCEVNGPIRFKRPIYPYPKFPHYVGGDVNVPSSYKGVEHARNTVMVPAALYLK